jgi:hypothetical protein
MVFKVKQRAPASYEEMIKDSLTSAGAEIAGATGQEAYANRIKGYNWPYDYFSMIELAKIDTTVTFRPDIDNIDDKDKETTEESKTLDGTKKEEAQAPPPKRGRPKNPPKKDPPKKRTTKKNPPKKNPPKSKPKDTRPKSPSLEIGMINKSNSNPMKTSESKKVGLTNNYNGNTKKTIE